MFVLWWGNEEQMYQQIDLFFFKLRFLFVGSIVTMAFLVVLSALVTSLGSHSILDTRTDPSIGLTSTTPDGNTSDVIASSGYALMNGTKHAMLSAGIALYSDCQSITTLATQSGRAIVHGSAITVRGIGSGIGFVGHGIGSGMAFIVHTEASSIMFTLRIPGKIMAPITHSRMVSDIIKPTDNKSVPVISNETSAAVLASFDAQQQQEIAQWQVAQLAANQGLDGSIVAGDPNHGGYPAKWDDAPQDSTLDSWGMYNRECVSYTAWKVYQTYGHMPFWGGVGNANQWVGDAEAAGIPTGSTPQVHSVAISMRGYYGHAMWVEAVSGNMIYVSQYNYDLNGQYSEMWVNGSSFTYIYFK